jgi:hypothetical protein
MKRFILFFIVLYSLLFTVPSHAAVFTDLKFGQAQIADSQWNVQACTQTATCQIYSKNPGTAYKIPWYSGQIQWAAGDYIQFQAWTPDPNNPWVAVQYSANGTQKAVMGTGHIINMGKDYFFFVGNDNDTGQLFSMTQGFSNTNGVTWTGTLNPTTAQVNTYAANGSTAPLAAGQTAGPATPPFDGTITQTNNPANQVITSGSGGTSDITNSQQTKINTWTNRSITDQGIWIDQIGNDNSITITQIGDKNRVTGIGQQSAQIQGNTNSISINQGVSGLGQNEIDLRVIGNHNTLRLNQAQTAQGAAVGGNGHYQSVDINGSYNTLTTQQSNGGGVGGHYMETTINGNQNTVTLKQTDNGNKIMFTNITGNTNTLEAVQKGTGQHYLDVKLNNGADATIVQEGSTANKATVDLTNAGGRPSLDLIQGGGKNFSIQQSCTNPAGCTTIVRQP